MVNKFSKWFIVIIFIILVSFFLLKNNFSKNLDTDQAQTNRNNIQMVKIAGQNIKVDLALTSEEQDKGLSGRTFLKEDNGMLFIFQKAARYSFWMKEMNLPIDIIWLNENLEVVYIKKNAQPSSYPNTFTPNIEAKYVLEIAANFSEKNNLKIGDKVQFLP